MVVRIASCFLAKAQQFLQKMLCGDCFFWGLGLVWPPLVATADLAAGAFFCSLEYLGVVCVKNEVIAEDARSQSPQICNPGREPVSVVRIRLTYLRVQKPRPAVEAGRNRDRIVRNRRVPACGHRPGYFGLGLAWL